MHHNSVRKKIFCQILVLMLILAISVPMVTAPVSSNILFSSSNMSVNLLVYAQEDGDDGGGNSDSSGGDGGDSDGGNSDSSGRDGGDSDGGNSDSSGGDGGDSDGGDQSTSSSSTTTTDPALAPSSSTTTTDPALAPSSSTTTTDPALAQSPLGLTFSTENTSPSLLQETEEQDLDCDDVSNRNFKVSSNDPNGFDRDNDGIGCESNDEDPNSGASPISVTGEGPDNDCLFDPDLPKCASNEGECPDGFFNNDDDQCVPEGGCPEGYHTVDDDETGRCISDSEGCPEGMIFRSDGKTCGSIEVVCEDSPELEECADTFCDPSYPDFCISPNQRGLNCDNHNGKVEPNEIFKYNFKVNQPDTQDFDRDGDGIGCEYGNGNGNDNDGNDKDQYIIKASNSCADISDTVDLSSEQIGAEEVRTIAYFGNCELGSASLQLNLVQNEDLKLVAANLNDGLSDAVEVEMNQVGQSDSDSNVLYEATITDNQEGQDLDTGETKTLNNVNGIVLWNDGEDKSIEFADNNFVEANINFFN
jgi:hypothetical protein